MTDTELKEEIGRFSWYQTIDFRPGISSKGSSFCGDPAWRNIRAFLPDSLSGLRIIDLGCNAGIFCVRAAIEGAEECIGVEDDSWKHSDYFKQAVFVSKFFNEETGRILPICLVNENMENFVHKNDFTQFDYGLGIASLYYAKDWDRLVNGISKICKNVIARIRDDNRIDLFMSLFEKHGYNLVKVLREEFWEETGKPADDFFLFHYAR